MIHNDVSSTKVRLFLRRGLSVRYLIPAGVVDYILQNGLYMDEGQQQQQQEKEKEKQEKQTGSSSSSSGLAEAKVKA